MNSVYKKQNIPMLAHAQIVYLHYELHKTPKQISKITGYSLSTTKQYIYKYNYLLNFAKETFDNKKQKFNTFYIIDFYKDGKFQFGKIGTTTRPIEKRIKEHLQYYGKPNSTTPANECKVIKTYDCENCSCELIESCIRFLYGMKYPNSYYKNDRFLNLSFADKIEEIDNIVNKCISEKNFIFSFT